MQKGSVIFEHEIEQMLQQKNNKTFTFGTNTVLNCSLIIEQSYEIIRSEVL